ncbi:hypothetical protein [Kribbella sp. DT2]|uniref:hypothetical protein n=1 Tax=Kribbella sp. DT2 TaxID=3393427 RepID=UPI003CFAD1B4
MHPLDGSAAVADPDAFDVTLKNESGNVYTIGCRYDDARPNSYGSDITTTRSPDLWYPVDGGTVQRWRIGFHRTNATAAEGGRCTTATTTTLRGSGDFSAHVYIHSNVADSVGVFTVAMLPEVFTVEEELDLFVANLVENGVKKVKMGTPGSSVGVPLADVEQQWITARLKKRGEWCQFSIDKADGRTVSLGTSPCHNSPTTGRVVVNARARNGSSVSSSFVTLDEVRWVKKDPSDPF